MAIVQPHREALSGSLRFTAQISSLRFIMCLMKYSCFSTLYQTNRTVGAWISQQTNFELQPKNPDTVLIFKLVTQIPFHFLETYQIDKTLLMTTKHKYLNSFVMNYSTLLVYLNITYFVGQYQRRIQFTALSVCLSIYCSIIICQWRKK